MSFYTQFVFSVQKGNLCRKFTLYVCMYVCSEGCLFFRGNIWDVCRYVCMHACMHALMDVWKYVCSGGSVLLGVHLCSEVCM